MLSVYDVGLPSSDGLFPRLPPRVLAPSIAGAARCHVEPIAARIPPALTKPLTSAAYLDMCAIIEKKAAIDDLGSATRETRLGTVRFLVRRGADRAAAGEIGAR